MKAILQSMKWSEKPKISKEMILISAVCLVSTVTFFKLRPYFQDRPRAITAPTHDIKPSGIHAALEHLEIGREDPKSHSPQNPTHGSMNYHAQRIEKRSRGPAVIERPLFDGLSVTVRAILLNAVSSHQPETLIEALINEVIGDESTSDIDTDPALGAKLMGAMTVNMSLKRLGFTFSELMGRQGQSYQVTGSAFDSEDHMTGIPANYSSGLGSRLLGVGLDQAITLADQVGMAKVLQNTAGNSTVTQQMQAASIVVSQQASTGIAAETTRGLRETPAELSLPAGTEISVRIKALPSEGGGRP